MAIAMASRSKAKLRSRAKPATVRDKAIGKKLRVEGRSKVRPESVRGETTGRRQQVEVRSRVRPALVSGETKGRKRQDEGRSKMRPALVRGETEGKKQPLEKRGGGERHGEYKAKGQTERRPNRRPPALEGKPARRDEFSLEGRSGAGRRADGVELQGKRMPLRKGGNHEGFDFIVAKGKRSVRKSGKVVFDGGKAADKGGGFDGSSSGEKRFSTRGKPRGKDRHSKKNMEESTAKGRAAAEQDELDKSSKKKASKYEPIVVSTKRKSRNKKPEDNGSALEEDKPKRKKRVIRLDRYDISNKRLDDGNDTQVKVVKQSPEISKNAEFRAIQPSPSILSCVEDNLLGRRRLIDLRRAGYNVKFSAPLDNIPFSTNLERGRIEENVFRNKLTFFAAAKVRTSFPPPDLPEIAFAGRSNVGKSSLLNALTRQWGVVRTSDKPGLTQTINFFKLASKLCLVDLPGYGFAYAKEEVKDAWEELVKEYVSTRVGLKRVCLLVDTQWGMKPRDYELINLMERSQTKYQIVLTKTDLVFPINVARRAMQIEENLQSNKSIVNPVMMVSSKSGAGIRSLRTVLAKLARFAM